MRYQGLLKFRALSTLSLLTLLAACAMGKTQPPPPIGRALTDVQKQQAIEPLACSEFAPMRFHPGLDGVTAKDVQDTMAAHPNDPIPWVRGLVGDTDATRNSVANYQGRRLALGCKTY